MQTNYTCRAGYGNGAVVDGRSFSCLWRWASRGCWDARGFLWRWASGRRDECNCQRLHCQEMQQLLVGVVGSAFPIHCAGESCLTKRDQHFIRPPGLVCWGRRRWALRITTLVIPGLVVFATSLGAALAATVLATGVGLIALL